MRESQQFFYLGKEDNEAKTLYKNKDLTTHALIIGMTGSGKTGLGVGLIEEAAIDDIPSIVIDPKGDMGNLLLTFPNLSKEEFTPWIDPEEAAAKNQSVDEAALETAKSWENGLREWDEDKGRVALLKERAGFTIYTPGASHGVGVNILSSFKAPPKEVLEDPDTFNALVSSLTTSILSLVGINADPIASKEHITVSSIFSHCYKNGQDLSLEELITLIATPPFDKIGVFSLDIFFPKDKRMDLAMRLNAIMASPSFGAWLEGESMDINGFLFDKDKKPKVSIFNIAHLNDNERMFFVTLLLNNIIGWIRTQEGTSSLRAIVYMDEIFGFFPPNANPPSKLPMLTLLKQARAFGLGVILSTQNPVDLDYKGLSNIGTWFIGRLQTAQDKERVIEGLLGAKGSGLNKQELFELISNLKKRCFLLKNINEESLRVFQTRWTLSYLKGPLTKEQIRKLTTKVKSKGDDIEINVSVNMPMRKFISNLKQYYLYESDSDTYRLKAYLVCLAKVRFVSTRQGVDIERDFFAQAPIANKEDVKWEISDVSSEFVLESSSRKNSVFDEIASFVDDAKRLFILKKEAVEFISRSAKLTILSAPELKLEAGANEIEEEFKNRVKTKLDEIYERKYKDLKTSYDKRLKMTEDRFSRLILKLDKEKGDVQNRLIDTVVSIGGGILGALLGGRKTSGVSKTASGIKNANKTLKERNDVKRVEREIEEVQKEANAIEAEFQANTQSLKEELSLSNTAFKEIVITPNKSDIYDERMFIVWREI